MLRYQGMLRYILYRYYKHIDFIVVYIYLIIYRYTGNIIYYSIIYECVD